METSTQYKEHFQKFDEAEFYKVKASNHISISRVERQTTSNFNKAHKYCKFDIYYDNQVGLEDINRMQKDEALIITDQDEDYATDGKILLNT